MRSHTPLPTSNQFGLTPKCETDTAKTKEESDSDADQKLCETDTAKTKE